MESALPQGVRDTRYSRGVTTTPTTADPPRQFWPGGFSIRPWRFLVGQPVWRAFGWTLCLAVVFIPALVATVILLPWLPLSARVADLAGRLAARWMKVEVPPRRANRWFDWPQAMELLAQLLLAFAAFALVVTLGTVTVFLAMIPFFYRNSVGGVLSFGFWETGWAPAVFAVCWILAVCGALLLLYVSWLITGCSVASAVLSNTTASEEVAELARSRAVLADAFTGERHRIERELHDGPQQYLTALQLNVATVELTARNGGDISGELENIKVNARRALDALRTTVRGIYPQVLADRGLHEALQELIAHSGVDGEVIDLRDTPPDHLTDTSALLLYHCSAEGMTNAVRHAHADALRITLKNERGSTVLTLDDNGVGLGGDVSPSRAGDTGGTGGTGGTGLAGLRERAAALGGTVTLVPSPADTWTTRLEMTLP